MIGDDLATATLWKALWDEGVYTNVALYPAVPPGGSLIRTSVMATHEREHLDRALEIFEGSGTGPEPRRASSAGTSRSAWHQLLPPPTRSGRDPKMLRFAAVISDPTCPELDKGIRPEKARS